MTDNFPTFSKAVHKRLEEISGGELYVVDVLDIFESYLNAFPEGTNPIFRERTEHDCSCCKNFIRNLGKVVAIDEDGIIMSVWDDLDLPAPYDVVASRLSELVRQAPIVSVYRSKERKYGAPHTFEAESNRKWHHFYGDTPKKCFSGSPDEARGRINTVAQVFERGLKELSLDSINTVIDLITDKAIYRGEEHLESIQEFALVKAQYEASANPSAFVWRNVNSKVARFRNTVIGTLITDLSDGVELEKAVKSFEAKVAPANYKRPKALITKGMIDKAVTTLRELDLEGALKRRFAKLSDVSVNNVLFVDNSVQSEMKDGLTDLLMESVTPTKVDVNHGVDISMDDFMANVVPKATSIELLVDNKHLGNFMSLTAPQDADTGKLFKWGNDFAWSYDGEVADSMREQVVAAGGRVDGVFRFTHSWNHKERNASLMDLHVFFPNNNPTLRDGCNDKYGTDQRVGWNHRVHPRTGGVQDVDYTNPAPTGYIPIENITFPDLAKMPEGVYTCKVHNWNLRRPTEGGFKAEIECGGQIYQYDYPKKMAHKEWVTVAEVTLKGGVFTVDSKIDSSTTSVKKWGLSTQSLVKVDTLMASPNHWDGEKTGNKHWFFILNGCKNPNETRGMYNEFLRSDLEQHRKVFEVLGTKTKCPASDEQLSGLGFSSTRKDSATVIVDKKAYNINF